MADEAIFAAVAAADTAAGGPGRGARVSEAVRTLLAPSQASSAAARAAQMGLGPALADVAAAGTALAQRGGQRAPPPALGAVAAMLFPRTSLPAGAAGLALCAREAGNGDGGFALSGRRLTGVSTATLEAQVFATAVSPPSAAAGAAPAQQRAAMLTGAAAARAAAAGLVAEDSMRAGLYDPVAPYTDSEGNADAADCAAATGPAHVHALGRLFRTLVALGQARAVATACELLLGAPALAVDARTTDGKGTRAVRVTAGAGAPLALPAAGVHKLVALAVAAGAGTRELAPAQRPPRLTARGAADRAAAAAGAALGLGAGGALMDQQWPLPCSTLPVLIRHPPRPEVKARLRASKSKGSGHKSSRGKGHSRGPRGLGGSGDGRGAAQRAAGAAAAEAAAAAAAAAAAEAEAEAAATAAAAENREREWIAHDEYRPTRRGAGRSGARFVASAVADAEASAAEAIYGHDGSDDDMYM